jgi:hypothetical protein
MERGDRPDRRRARRSASARAAALVAGTLVVAGLVSSCSLDGLDFVRDDRLHLEGLDDRDETDLPIELTWQLDGGFRDDEAAFAVIVDRTPPRPGHSLASLLDDDPACAGPQGCPDGYLERNRLYVTTDTSIVIDDVVEGTARQEARGFHEVTIVLVDTDGVRVGELAEAVRFRLPGRDA